jgi:hypothetical protein
MNAFPPWCTNGLHTIFTVNNDYLSKGMNLICLSIEMQRVFCQVKVKLKCALVQTLRICTGRTAHTGSRGIALLSHDHGTRRGEGSALRPGRSLPPGKTRYTYCTGGWLGPRVGLDRWKISPPTGIRSPDRPARSQSLYRLSYSTHLLSGRSWIFKLCFRWTSHLKIKKGHNP